MFFINLKTDTLPPTFLKISAADSTESIAFSAFATTCLAVDTSLNIATTTAIHRIINKLSSDVTIMRRTVSVVLINIIIQLAAKTTVIFFADIQQVQDQHHPVPMQNQIPP